MELELRFCELRQAEGRILTGTVLRYGDEAVMPWGRETILPGAFGDVSRADLALNYFHIREHPLARTGHGLTLNDSADALELRAEIANTTMGNDALALVKSGALRGFSIEFRCEQDSYDYNGTRRTIHRARLNGVGLVDVPAYRQSLVEERLAALEPGTWRQARTGYKAWPLL